MVLDIITDPNVPPLPPHVSFEQAKQYMKALLHGDPDATQVVAASAREAWATLTAHG